MKDVLKEMKNQQTSKFERDETAKRCFELYVPPGIIHCHESPLKKQSVLDQDIKKAIPSDQVFKRFRTEQRILGVDRSTTLTKTANSIIN